ncbi:hypothetical protein CYLTODRAFT_391123 [Cylindrobasidium torrendii FP15055 ss-10]|uniref:Pre-rRNA-processing protein TSR2 n=1 Tax=Cylindrobasidium torrendii FP15055 ss-10 TaxID=1314674 RepID=A0A0D7BL49_9AGAR|nr:hypothetical protein CYLTODRAFT_391123 [Cylindrobasidium torrendii FP15055 ss-10]
MSTSTSSVLFARGVIARLHSWNTLALAVQENWGGPHGADKRTWLASSIVDTFEEQADTPDDQYIEEMLLQVMDDEFDTVLEDGSAEPVAVDICKIWDESRRGVDTLVKKFEDIVEKTKGKKIAAPEMEEIEEDSEGDESGEDEDEEMDEDPAPQLIERKPKAEPVVDDDGFTLVQKGKR